MSEFCHPDRRRSGARCRRARQKPDGKLTVNTYESFTAEWGLGPKVKLEHSQNSATALWTSSDRSPDGVALLNRLKNSREHPAKADVVLGLDTNLTYRGEARTGLLAPHAIDTSAISTFPAAIRTKRFVPYDYGDYRGDLR